MNVKYNKEQKKLIKEFLKQCGFRKNKPSTKGVNRWTRKKK